MQTTSVTQVALALETFIRARFQVPADDPRFDHEIDLWTEGYLDSLGVVEVIEFVQETFNIVIPNELLFDPDFVRISGMSRLISQLADDSVAVMSAAPFPQKQEGWI
jgi:acyl carrier protein